MSLVSLGWVRRMLGRNPQSVADYDSDRLRKEDSILSEVPCPGPKDPSLPVDVSGCTGFNDLPDEILEQIFVKLAGTGRKNYFAVSGVSKAWRRIGQRMFFHSPWDTPHLICHPSQIFYLSPRIPSGSRSGLLKCFVRREASTPRGDAPGRRIFMFLGKDPQNLPKARFLLAAVPRGRHQVFIYLNSKCEGTPCARLTSNFMCNSYTLTLEDGMSYLLEPPAAPAVPSIASEAGTSGFLDHTQRAGKNLSNAALTRSDLRDDEISVLDGENTSVVGEQAPIPGSKLLPQLLLSLKYRARIRGLMQPRRMEAILPNPEQVRCRGTLPWLQYGSGGEQRRGGGNLPTGSGSGNGNFSNGNGLHPSPAGPGHHRMGRRPSLTTISAVAALELIPSAVLNNNSNSIASGSGGDPGASGSGSGTSAATTPPTLAPLTIPSDGGNAGPSTSFSSPGTSFGSSSGYNSSVPSPEAPAVVGESSNTTSDDATRTGGQAPSGTAPGSPPPPEGHAVAPSQAAWRRALRLRLLRQPRVAADTVDESALPVGLRNKDPHWNEALRCWCLNFRGRVKLASVKNFQLVKDRDEDTRPVMQFGKVERNSFILDFNPTALTTIQAFAIALTTFDSKVTL